jgi:hypothetical protein
MDQISFAVWRPRKASSEGCELGKDVKVTMKITSEMTRCNGGHQVCASLLQSRRPTSIMAFHTQSLVLGMVILALPEYSSRHIIF